jgi:hypothetical protein
MAATSGLYHAAEYKKFSASVIAASSSSNNEDPEKVPPKRKTMSTDVLCVGDLLTDAYQMVVPIYQRVYDWTSVEIELLLDDFTSNLDPARTSDQLQVLRYQFKPFYRLLEFL